MSPDEARKSRAYGYVFQHAGLYPWRTISKNIQLPLEIMNHETGERERRVAKVMELVDLTGFENKYPWQLSGGMQQRVSIARALAFDADILLMDEPFGALDEIRKGPPQRAASRFVAAHRKDNRLCDALDSRGRLSLKQDRGDEPAPWQNHQRDQVDAPEQSPP